MSAKRVFAIIGYQRSIELRAPLEILLVYQQKTLRNTNVGPLSAADIAVLPVHVAVVVAFGCWFVRRSRTTEGEARVADKHGE
jgi:hypothetical protein